MKQRVVTALVLAPIAIAMVLFLPSGLFATIMAALALLALWEWTRLVGLTSVALRSSVIAACAAVLAILWFAREAPLWWIVIAIGLAWWFVALWWLRHFSFGAAPTRENRRLKLAAGALSIVPAWAAIIELHQLPDLGNGWALLALMLVWAADSAAYLSGRRFGTTKLAPRISPGKTWAGVYGGFAGAAVIAVIGGLVLDQRGFALAILIAVSLVTVAASVVGDLFESLLKRQANVKDSGTMFPGHGGLLDRMDSLFAGLPVFAVGKLVLDLFARS